MSKRRFIRGGSLGSDFDYLRTSYRNWVRPEDQFGGAGFRIVVIRWKKP